MLTYKRIKQIAFLVIIIVFIINVFIIFQMSGRFSEGISFILMGLNILIASIIIILLFFIRGKSNSDSNLKWIK